MSFRERRRIYPQQGRVTLDGGLNTKFEQSLIEDNESPDCANVVFGDGAVATRDGTKKLNTAAIGSFVIDGLATRHADTDVETMVAFAGGTAWALTGTSFITIGSAQSVFTAGVRVMTAEQENHLFIGNGGVIPYKYASGIFTRHGVYPPESAPVLTSTAVGVLTGDFSYKVTFVNSALVESDVGPVATFVGAAGGTITVTMPTAPQSWGISSRRIYRNDGSAFKRVVEVSTFSTNSYADNIATAALGVTAPTDNGVPPKYSVLCYHQNRLFMNDPANPDYVWWTDIESPYTVGSLNFMKIGDASGDTVRTISVYQNSILVKCSYSSWLIYMPSTDDADWEKIRVNSNFGSRSPFVNIDYDNKQLFAATENGKFVGFAAIAGTSIEPSASFLTIGTMGGFLKSDRIEPDMFNIASGYISGIAGISYKNRAYIAVPYGTSATNNNRIYCMDYSISNLSKNQKEAWVPFTGLSANCFTIYNGNLYYGSSTANGFVYQMEAGVYHDGAANGATGTAIDSYFWTKEFSGYKEDYNWQKDFRYANVLVEKPAAYSMNFTYRTDSDTSVGSTQTIDLTPGSSLWGTLVWGVGLWSSEVAQEDVTVNLGAAFGKRIQFKFSNQNVAGQMFKVHGINMTYNLKGQR